MYRRSQIKTSIQSTYTKHPIDDHPIGKAVGTLWRAKRLCARALCWICPLAGDAPVARGDCRVKRAISMSHDTEGCPRRFTDTYKEEDTSEKSASTTPHSGLWVCKQFKRRWDVAIATTKKQRKIKSKRGKGDDETRTSSGWCPGGVGHLLAGLKYACKCQQIPHTSLM